jgi:SAM-dependent methyltransferase
MVRSAVFNLLRKSSSYKTRQWFKRQPWFVPVSRALFGNGVYCDSYYRDVERLELASVGGIADWIVKNLGPKRLIDVGCGPGHQMKALADRGVEVYGVDISDAALAITTNEKKLKAEKFDLTQTAKKLPGIPYDMALSCEVAEHLEEQHAATFVDHLVAAAPVVYLTAAEPNPKVGKGLNHFNEQPHSYWIKLFEDRGYEYQKALTEAAQGEFAAKKINSYLARPMIFKKK